MRVELVVIDGIKAFLEEGRPLGLKGAMPGAVRAAKMIKADKKKIRRIYAFIDAHHKLHVNHRWYWIETKTNTYPRKGTLIPTEALKQGLFRPINPAWTKDMIEYSEALDKKERYCIYIFDDHALIGTDECTVVEPLQEAYDEWLTENMPATIDFRTKGSCVHREHFSGLQAEIPHPEDPFTQLDTKMVGSMKRADILALLGWCNSHCLLWTGNDIADNFGAENIKKIVYIEDATAPVPGFEKEAEEGIQKLINRGMQVTTTDKFWKFINY